MSEKHSLASKARWANKSKEEKSIIMTELAKKKASKMTSDERKNHSRMMNQARIEKKLK